MKHAIATCGDNFLPDNEERALECGDLSPLSLPKRLVALAEPRAAARRTTTTQTNFGSDARPEKSGAPLDAVLLGRQVVPAEKAVTSHRTPYFDPNSTQVD
jgi:hypothetical protein